jgi:succinate dehydrogenase/fumarate reductase flavoprotein subunit
MWRQVGILRNGKDLTSAIGQLESIELPKSEKPGRAEYELRNLRELALLMTRSALARHESRGSHYRSDFPYRDDEDFCKHSIVQKSKDVRFEI